MWRRPWLVAMLALVGCGDEPAPAPASLPEPPPERIDPGGPPSVPVQQLRPAHPLEVGWLSDTLVYATSSEAGSSRLYVWEPESGRVLHDGATPYQLYDPVFTTEGVLVGSSLFSLRTGLWADASADHPVYTQSVNELASPPTLTWSRNSEEVARVEIGPGAVTYPWHGRLAAVCSSERATLFDARGWQVASFALEGIQECIWSDVDGPLVILTESGSVLIDPSTMRRIGGLFPRFTQASLSRDGRRVAVARVGSAEGISVYETETGREVFHVSLAAPDWVRLVGDVVAYGQRDAPNVGGAYQITDAMAGRVVVEDRAPFGWRWVGPHGVISLEDDLVVVRDVEGREVARWDQPLRAGLDVEDGQLFALADLLAFRIDERLGIHAFGICPRPPDSSAATNATAAWSRLSVGGRWHEVRTGCVSREDGTVVADGSALLAAAAEAEVSVWLERGALVVHAGSRSVPLILDEGEAQPCRDLRCPMPIAVSPDGAHVAVARGPLLRVFDSESGEAVGRASVSELTRQILFGAGQLVHRAVGGEVTLFRLPRLQRVAHWEGDRFVDASFASGLVLTGGRRSLSVHDSRGREVARRDLVGGWRSVLGSFVVVDDGSRAQVLALGDLSTVAELEGVVLGGAGTEVVTCRGGHYERTRLAEGSAPVSVPLTLPCAVDAEHLRDAVSPFGEGVYLIERSGQGPMLLRADGATLVLGAVALDSGLVLTGHTAEGSLGSGALTLLRSPAITSEGMIEAPHVEGTIAEWLAAGR